MKILPESYLRCMSPEDRKALGKAGQTRDETLSKAEAKSEKELQRQIVSLLRLKGIEPIVSRMDRRTTNNVGTPDILFAVGGYQGSLVGIVPFACAIEVKLPGNPLKPQQEDMARRLQTNPNRWTHEVIRSVDEMRAFLAKIGI